MNRRFKWPLWLCGILLTGAVADDLPPVEVPLATDLRAIAPQVKGGCLPLLLEFSSEYCEYCDLLEEEILHPMLRNRDYDRRVIMRKIVLGSATAITDFDGKPIEADRLGQRYNIFVTPTLIFTDHRGREIAERMVGVTTLDFYGGYLDQALDAGRKQLREQYRCKDS